MTKRILDEIDERLLALLEKNARQPVVALARAVGLSRSAVQDRLARLEDDKAIAEYTIVRGSTETRASVRAVMMMKIATQPCEPVLKRFTNWPEVLVCWSVAGLLVDAVLLVDTDSSEALGDLRERLASIPGVSDLTTGPVLRTLVDRRTAQRRYLPEN